MASRLSQGRQDRSIGRSDHGLLSRFRSPRTLGKVSPRQSTYNLIDIVLHGSEPPSNAYPSASKIPEYMLAVTQQAQRLGRLVDIQRVSFDTHPAHPTSTKVVYVS